MLGFLPTYVRTEVEALGSLGVETEIWLPGADGFIDSITGSDLPAGSVSGGTGGDLVTGSPTSGQVVGSLLSTARAFLGHPRSMAGLTAEAFRVSCPTLMAYGARLADALAKNPPDRIHSHFAWEPAAVAMWASRMLGIPWSLTVHAADIFTPRRPATVGLMLSKACPLFTISDFDRLFIMERWGTDAGSGAVVNRLGIEQRDLPEWSGKGSGLIWCMASGLADKKGVEVLLEACAVMKSVRSGWRCIIAGSDRSGDKLRRCREKASGMGLDGFVEFPGALPAGDVLAGTARAAAAVLPCMKAPDGDMDGIPIALMEAMGMGVPVVSTRLSGIPELIEDGVSGLLTDPGDPSALAETLLRLMGDPETSSALGSAARARISGQFSAVGHARRMIDSWMAADSCDKPAGGVQPGS